MSQKVWVLTPPSIKKMMMDDENQWYRTANVMELTLIDHLGHLT